MNELSFDHVFHLAGEQIIPNYMGIKLCECPEHTLLTTDRTKSQWERLRSVLGFSEPQQLRHVTVPATQYPAIRGLIEETVAKLAPSVRVGFNITGGTKPMSAAALDVCRDRGIVPFYLDTETRHVRFFREPFAEPALPPVFSRIEEFIRLSGRTMSSPGKSPEDALPLGRRRLVKEFWQERDAVRIPIADFAEATDRRYSNAKIPPEPYWRALDQLAGWANRKNPRVAECWFAEFPDGGDWLAAATFAGGGWFEEFTLMLFSDYAAKGGIVDLRIGVRVAADEGSQQARDLQEIDVAYTDGFGLTLIECKAGRILQDHVQKLENLRLALGGSFGKGVLASINRPDDVLAERIRLGMISMVWGKECGNLPTLLPTLKPKSIVGA